MKRLLDFDPNSGVSHVFHWDNETELSTITVEQEVAPILDVNKALSNEQGKRFSKDGELGTKVASLPLSVWADLRKQGILNDKKAFFRWLNNPDNRFFRTHEATL